MPNPITLSDNPRDYEARQIKLYCSDCLEILPTFGAGSVDMVMADPPYGTTACKWDSVIPLEPMWEQLKRVVKPRGAIVMTASQPFTTTLVVSNMEMFKYEWIWIKSKATDFLNANYRPMKKHENVVVFSRGDAAPKCKNKMLYNPQGLVYKETDKVRHGSLGIARDRASQQGEYKSRGTNYPTSILNVKNATKTVHPTQKPVALMSYLILTYTNSGDTVLDFAMGSGTTGVACVQTGRSFIGIELDPGYFQIAKQRIEEAQMQPRLEGLL